MLENRLNRPYLAVGAKATLNEVFCFNQEDETYNYVLVLWFDSAKCENGIYENWMVTVFDKEFSQKKL